MAINFLNDGNFPDDAKLTFGNSGDLEIYHDGSNSFIRETGTGNFYLRASDSLYVQRTSDGLEMAQFTGGGGSFLFYNGSLKFGTTNTGIDVTGNITIENNTPKLTFNNTAGGGFYPSLNASGSAFTISTTSISPFSLALDDGQLTLEQYGSQTFTGTSSSYLIADSTGNIIEKTPAQVRSDIGAGTGTVTGSGAANKVAYWSSSSALTYDNGFTFNGTTLGLTGDNDVLNIGTGGAGTTSLFAWTGDTFYIQQDSASGNIQIETDDFIVKNHGASETYIRAQDNSSVQLYYNNSEKLETQSDGIQVTGNIDIDSNGEIELDGNGGMLLNTAPSGNEGNGIIIKLHSSTTTAGSLYYKSNFAAAWSEVNAASGDGATRMLGVALGTNSGTSGMLLQGLFRKASHGFSAGAPLYVGETNGAFTTTAPSDNGDYVRIVGYVVDSNIIYFNPSGTWVEVS